MKETNDHSVPRYTCSNPNCRKVFSRPKIIKYYVCPSCQTLVEMAVETTAFTSMEAHAAMKKEALCEHQKVAKHTSESRELNQDPANNHPTKDGTRRQPVKNLVSVDQLDVKQPKIEEPVGKEQPKTAETPPAPSSSPDCKYRFGYLNQRKKGEGIPDTCILCPRALDCMLSEHYKSEETVTEIKKWYHS